MGQFEDMQTFVRIVDAGSISRAAEHLGIAKSAVSRRLVDLEHRLGVQLLNRTTRKSSLTEAGQSYHERAQQIIADVNDLNADTSNATTTKLLTGSLKIAAPLSFGLMHLTPAINTFAKAHPDLILHMDLSDRQVDLVEDGFDVAIRIAELKDSSLIVRKLSPIRFAICASQAYLDAHGSPETPRDLKNHRILNYPQGGNTAWKLTDKNNHETTVRLPVQTSSNNGDFLCDAATNDLGIARLPTFVAWKELQSGALVEVLNDYTLPSINAYVVYPQTRHLSTRVRTFMDFLIKEFHGEPVWDKGRHTHA